ncbi:pirin family protein [Dyadobacter arcticus]|uniref:Quercetin 2,3-dioxygenase C-terminal cupin domain-containing protein n=1 Tax=Dyadobacter arcticus TaxID=1078754 RepID=A0ABX0UCY4_9BACT|nr:hypothetical protein [Dyadobacter arcticus]NIJ50867.1 hypothetical protein [Dyadobacter arcticus]
MLTQTAAQIFLQAQRGLFQTDSFRSFRTFNFDEYHAEGREAFGHLLTVNDETLLAQCSQVFKVEEVCKIILIPLVGGVEVNVESSVEFVDSGETFAFFASTGKEFIITNPYSEGAINYLQIRIKSNDQDFKNTLTQFDLLDKNTLLTVFSGDLSEANIYLGKYGGREEGIFEASKRGVFAFVIEGAFEVQNRLLEKRDGLSVLGADEIEFEALSNDAVILVVED